MTVQQCEELEREFALIKNCVKESALSTLPTACNTEITYEGPGEVNQTFDGIIGVISLIGDGLWVLMIGLPKETAEPVAVNFAGFEVPFEGEDMGDIVGELANIMAGDLVARMEMEGIKVQMSLPSVARGSRVEMIMPGKPPSFTQKYSCELGDFWIRVATREKENH